MQQLRMNLSYTTISSAAHLNSCIRNNLSFLKSHFHFISLYIYIHMHTYHAGAGKAKLSAAYLTH